MSCRDKCSCAEFQECDDRLESLLIDGPVYCARRLGHRGPHSTDRHPGLDSMTWREATQ